MDRTSRQPLSSVKIASGLAVHILFVLCCRHGFAFDKGDEVEVVMQRAFLEGAWEGWVDDSERGYQCGQTGKGPGEGLLLWFGK